jgi:hypothetical protein
MQEKHRLITKVTEIRHPTPGSAADLAPVSPGRYFYVLNNTGNIASVGDPGCGKESWFISAICANQW